MAKSKYQVEAYVRQRGSLKSYRPEWFKVEAENEEKARDEVRVICASKWMDIESFGVALKEKPSDHA